MKNSVRIKAIKTTETGEKLIAFCRVFNNRYFTKPYESDVFFASYKNDVLSIYNRNDFEAKNFNSFKLALSYLRNFTDF